MPSGGSASRPRSAAPTTQRTGRGPGRACGAPAGSGEIEDAAGDLAFEGRGVEVALAGDDEVGILEAGGKADEVRHEVEAGEEAGAQHEQAAAEAACGAGSGGRGDVDAHFGAVTGGQVVETLCEELDLARAWPLFAGRRSWRRL